MTDQNHNFIFLKDPDTRRKLLGWWAALADDRGARALLRRAERPDDVLLTEPFFQFLHEMPKAWSDPEILPTAAMVAATLAHVKENDNKTFAARLASRKEGTDRPHMSELRFRQLQKSRDPDEFFRRLLRAVHLAGNKVNLCSLADDIWHWMKEYRYSLDREPQKRLSVRWATDYYTALSKGA